MKLSASGLSLCLSLYLIADNSYAQSLTYTLGSHGVNSLGYAGQTLVNTDSFLPQTTHFIRPDGTSYDRFDPAPVYTRNGNSFTIVHSQDGTMFARTYATYTQAGDSLIVDFGTYNPHSTDTILISETALMSENLSLPPAPQAWSFAVTGAPKDGPDMGVGQQPRSYGAVPISAWDLGTHFQSLGGDPGLGLSGTPRPGRDSAVFLDCYVHPDGQGCGPRVALEQIGPGQTKTRRFYLRFAPTGANPYVLNADLFQKYNAAKPQQLGWQDRRPILQDSTLAQGLPNSSANPRRYLSDQPVDVTSNAGKSDFRRRLLARAADSIQRMTSAGAQGIITWSIEGIESQWSAYTGDPSRVQLAPEMEYVDATDQSYPGMATVDAYMKAYRDAGFRVGNLLRPQGLHNVQKEIGTQFKPSVNGTITRLRAFATYFEVSGVRTARIWRDTDGALVGGPYQWTYGGTNSWQELDIPDLAVSAGTEYTISVSTTDPSLRGGFPEEPAADTWLANAGGHMTYRALGVTTDGVGTRPANPLVGWGPMKDFRDVVFVPAGQPEETLFGATQPNQAFSNLQQYDVTDPGQRLIDLVTYCNQRWGSTLFYVDTSSVLDMTSLPGMNNAELEPSILGGGELASDFFKRAQEAFPNVLLIPENQVSNDYAYTAPYDVTGDGVFKTVQKVTSQWPGAFSVLLVDPNNHNAASYIDGARHGDIFLFQPNDESFLNSLYQQSGHPPSVTITAPTNNATISVGGSITVNANATDSDGTINRVEFYASTVESGRLPMLGQDTSSPYSFTWTNVPAGRYVLSARAVDNAGLEMWSKQIVLNSYPPEKQFLTGDFENDGTGDIFQTYRGWASIPVCNYTTSGFSCTNPAATIFDSGSVEQRFLPIDYDTDQKTDIIQVWRGWHSIPLCLSTGTGWSCSNPAATIYDSGSTEQQFIVGDFDGDGRKDVFQTWRGWSTIPVCRSVSGGWSCTNPAATIQDSGSAEQRFHVADVNNDGKADILQTWRGWSAIPTCVSNGSSWTCTNRAATIFNSNSWEQQFLTGDFNGDGKTDVVQTWRGWHSLPLCLSTGTAWSCSNPTATIFDSGSAEQQFLTGDFNGDGKMDVVQTYRGWSTIPLCLSTGSGWNCTNPSAAIVDSGSADQRFVATDINHDGKTDIVQVYRGWSSYPVCLSTGTGWNCSVMSATIY